MTKFRTFHRRILTLAVLGILNGLLSPLFAQSGIFADFTTSMGDFSCQLDFTNAPRPVANFIGLATGERPWMDLNTGRVRYDAFYDSLTFHRTITNFMIQAGSPKGDGSDTPGYVFKNQFSSKLKFDGYGVLAMANSGPNTDGAQFFVTVAPYANGNNNYTIFGKLVSGSNVVYAISRVETDSNDKPLTNVVIEQVAIRRSGAQALAFNIHSQGLPLITNPPVAITCTSGVVNLSFRNPLWAHSRFYTSTNLTDWSGAGFGLEVAAASITNLQKTLEATNHFYRVAQTLYPEDTLAPRSLLNTRITLVPTSGSLLTVPLVLGFPTSGNPFGVEGTLASQITSYTWSQEAYRGYIWPLNFTTFLPMIVRLDFTSRTNGTFAATIYQGIVGSPSSGTFTTTKLN
jgi:peptidyl-prolyl cis-trans isomerase A (cyclophilin A)